MPRILKINHIGFAVDSLSQGICLFSDGFGIEVAGSEEVPGDGVRVAFLPVGESNFELLEPVGEAGPVHKFLSNRGPGIHHICLEVDDLPGLLEQLRTQGIELIDDKPRPGAHDAMVAFVHPKSANGVLIELVESSSLRGDPGTA